MRLFSSEIIVEPSNCAFSDVEAVFRLTDTMSFVLVDYKLGLDAQRLQRMPELIRLRCRTLYIAITDHYERRRLDFLYVGHRRALRVYGRVVIDRGSEEGNHPLINS